MRPGNFTTRALSAVYRNPRNGTSKVYGTTNRGATWTAGTISGIASTWNNYYMDSVRHLAADGAVILGEPGRPTGDEFLQWIADRPWTAAMHLERIATRDKPVRVLVLRRRTQ